MDSLVINSFRLQDFDYCSKRVREQPLIYGDMKDNKATAFYYTRIMEIMQKEYLCRHDIQNINANYLAMQKREVKAVTVSEPNSSTFSKQIANVITEIVNKKEISVRELLNLYQLQDFVDKRLPIEKAFTKALHQFRRTPDRMIALAKHLSFCSSEELFNQAVDDIFGEDGKNDETVRVILNQKRELFQQIKQAKEELVEIRDINPTKYPSYLDVILDSGAIDLYNHLLAMRTCSIPEERERKIQDMDFAELSRVILQVRNTIIHTVESSIHSSGKQSILFLLGVTGAGKSTSLSFLRGDQMRKVGEDNYGSIQQPEIIGHDDMESCTFLPMVEIIDDLVMVDYPGFSDTNGSLIALGAECALKWLVKAYQPKILVIHPITDTEGRYKGVADMHLQLQRLLGDTMRSCLLGITKYSHTKVFSELRAIKKEKKELIRKQNETLELNQQLEKEIEQIEKNNKALVKESQEMQAKFNSFLQNPNEISANPMVFQELSIKKGEIEIELVEQTSKQKETKKRFSKTQKKLQKIEVALGEQETFELEKTQLLEEREGKLLKAFGLTQKIQFFDLEDQNSREECLDILSELTQKTSISLEPSLDPSHKQLLTKQLGKLLKNDPAKTHYGTIKTSKDFESFTREALELSLTHAIFSSSHPEIGKLLHLPEIDPTIVRRFDKEIVEICIKKCLESELIKLNLGFLEAVKNELKIHSLSNRKINEKIQECEQKIDKMIKYLVNIIQVVSEEKEIQEAWENLKNIHKDKIDKAKMGQLEYSPPSSFGRLMPDFGAIKIFLKRKSGKSEEIEKALTNYAHQLDEGHIRLVRLKELEVLIQKQAEINEILERNPLSFQSPNGLFLSVKDRAARVKDLYGDWENRIQFLSEKLEPQFSDLIASHLSNVALNWALKFYTGTKEFAKVRLKGEVASLAFLVAAGLAAGTVTAPVLAVATVGMIGVNIFGIKAAKEKSDELPLVESYLHNFGDAGLASLILSLDRNSKVTFVQMETSPVLKKRILEYSESHPSLLSCVNENTLFLLGKHLDLKNSILNAIIYPLIEEAKAHGYFSKEFPELYECILTKIYTDVLEESLAGRLKERSRRYAFSKKNYKGQKNDLELLNEMIDKAIIRFEKGWLQQLTVSIETLIINALFTEQPSQIKARVDMDVRKVVKEAVEKLIKEIEKKFSDEAELTPTEIERKLAETVRDIQKHLMTTVNSPPIIRLKENQISRQTKESEEIIAREIIREFKMRKRWPKVLSFQYQELEWLRDSLPKENFTQTFLTCLSSKVLDAQGITEEIMGSESSNTVSPESESHARDFKYGFFDGSNDCSHSFKYEGFPLWRRFFNIAKELEIRTETPLSQALLQDTVLNLWKEEVNKRISKN